MSLDLVKLYDSAGTFIKDAALTSGNFSTMVDQGSGNKGIKGKTVDDAGNISAFSSVKNYFAGCTNTPTCDLLDDTGKSSTDNLTNDDTPRIEVDLTLPVPTGAVAVANSSVKSFELWHKVGAGSYAKVDDLDTITPSGSTDFSAIFQFVSSLDDDDHYFKAKWVDSQNNVSGYGTELHIIVDTSAPNVPTISIDDGSVYVGEDIEIAGTATE